MRRNCIVTPVFGNCGHREMREKVVKKMKEKGKLRFTRGLLVDSLKNLAMLLRHENRVRLFLRELRD